MWECNHNTSSSKLTKWTITKLECLPLARLSSRVFCNTLAYRADSYGGFDLINFFGVNIFIAMQKIMLSFIKWYSIQKSE
jgi:hypothetical protein